MSSDGYGQKKEWLANRKTRQENHGKEHELQLL